MYKETLKEKHIAGYVFKPRDMVIDQTGCERKLTNLSEWLAIKLD